jgi:hypothetical protein
MEAATSISKVAAHVDVWQGLKLVHLSGQPETFFWSLKH